MPSTCFSFPAEVPSAAGSRDAAPASQRDPRCPGYPCFSYPNTGFSYPEDLPRAGASDVAQPPLPRLRRMPYGTCFRY